jgi:hypothetical protein
MIQFSLVAVCKVTSWKLMNVFWQETQIPKRDRQSEILVVRYGREGDQKERFADRAEKR